MNEYQMIESYMVFGGIPYYMNCFDRRLSLAQNIEQLCFHSDDELFYEFDQLFQSLLKHHEKHPAIIHQLAKSKNGVTRTQLAQYKDIGGGEPLTKALKELEQCGFIQNTKIIHKQNIAHFIS